MISNIILTERQKLCVAQYFSDPISKADVKQML
jgi:hypothetical protein